MILGRQARRYARDLDPALRWPSFLERLQLFLLFGVALVVVLATLRIPVHAASRAEARQLRFGYPLHFVEGDASLRWTGSFTGPFDPWEDAGHVLPVEFFLDWGIVVAALGAPFLLVRRRTS